MKTITFYSYKGGTGRSLAVANAARYLARLNFKVVALDFDLEAPGLHYKFSNNEDGKPIAVQTGIVDYLHEFITEGSIPESLDKFVTTINVPGTNQPLLRLIPAGHGPSAEYWQKLSHIDWHELFYAPDAKGVQLFLDLKQRISDELNPDFLLIDSRTGITEMGGVAATLLADRVICLVLPSMENMEGARAVLRSLKRTRREMGEEEIELMLTLSRLPNMQNNEEESTITSRIKSFFNEETENLEDTLSCQEISTLHTEKSLELRETLLVGGKINVEESILLRDYLRLFATLVPQELIMLQVDALVQQAKVRMWDDPEGALYEMEELAESFGHPEIYRALFQFYNVRNIKGTEALQKAQRFWQLSNDTKNPWVWTVIQNSFKPASVGYIASVYSKFEKEEWLPDLNFISAMWKDAGAYEENVGRRLAEAYGSKEQYSKAADIYLDILNHTKEPTSKIVAACLNSLRRAKRNSEVGDIIELYRLQFSESPEFIKAWAEYALAMKHDNFLNELTTSPFLGILGKEDSYLPITLLEAVGRSDDADAWAESILKQGDIHPNRQLVELGMTFKKRGKWEVFEKHVRSNLSEQDWTEFKSRFRRGF